MWPKEFLFKCFFFFLNIQTIGSVDNLNPSSRWKWWDSEIYLWFFLLFLYENINMKGLCKISPLRIGIDLKFIHPWLKSMGKNPFSARGYNKFDISFYFAFLHLYPLNFRRRDFFFFTFLFPGEGKFKLRHSTGES